MTPQDFAYWLQGFFEIQNPQSIDEHQTEMIKTHLGLVFTNVTNKQKNPIGFNLPNRCSMGITCSYDAPKIT